jgi:altronate dehydratase
VLFTTGRGTPTGSPLAPTLKIATNARIAQGLTEIIDFDASDVLRGTTLAEAAARLLTLLLATAEGSDTCADRNQQRDFALPPLGATSARVEMPL